MKRFAPHLASLSVVAFLTALSDGAVVLAVVLLVPLVGLTRWSWDHWRDAEEQDWPSRSGDPTTAAPRRRASGLSVIRALGWVEARQLALSPWFTAGLGMCVVMVISFAPTYEASDSWWQVVDDLPFLAHPVVGMAVLAAHRSATRAERDGATELVATTPALEARRPGVVASAWVPAGVVTLFSAAYLAVVGATTDVEGRVGAAAVPTAVGAIVLGAGGVVLGVALARWVRAAFAPVVAVVAVGFVSLRLGEGAPGEYRPRMLLSTFGTSILGGAPEPVIDRAWLHVFWLVAITVVTAAVAVTGTQESDRDALTGFSVRRRLTRVVG